MIVSQGRQQAIVVDVGFGHGLGVIVVLTVAETAS